MRNESLCKVFCHNLCCLIGSIYELGLESVFRGLRPSPTATNRRWAADLSRLTSLASIVLSVIVASVP